MKPMFSTQPLAPGAANELSTKMPSVRWMIQAGQADDFRPGPAV